MELELTWEKVFLLAIVPLGQLYARINYFKGSVDKAWSLFPIFMVPPFSFIPLIMMKLKWIRKGEGGEAIDKLIIIPILFKLFGDSILKSFFVPDEVINLASKALVFFSLYMVYFIKDRKCKDGNVKKIKRSITNSILVFGLSEILNEIFTNFIPTFGFLEKLIKTLPFGQSLIWVILIVSSYVINNMLNNTDIDNFCKNKYYLGKASKKGLSYILLAVSALRNIPFNRSEERTFF